MSAARVRTVDEENIFTPYVHSHSHISSGCLEGKPGSAIFEFTLSGIPPSAAEDSSIRSRILLASQGVSRIETRQSYKGAGDPIYTPAHVKTLPSECLYHQICIAIGSLVSLSLWLSLPLRVSHPTGSITLYVNADTTSLAKQQQPASRYKKRAMYISLSCYQSTRTSIGSAQSLPVAWLLRLAYSLCRTLFFALINTSPDFAPPRDSRVLPETPAPILDRVLPRDAPAPAPKAVASAARCDASLAMTLEREMRGLRPGNTLGFGGIGGFDDDDAAGPTSTPDLTILSAAAVRDIGERIVAGLSG